MKFVAISDTHCRHRSLKLPDGDVLLHAGDIGYRSDIRELKDFLDWFGGLKHPYKIFIAGNNDFFLEKEKPAAIKKLLPKTVHYLKDEDIEVEGITIWGSPYTPWFHQWAFSKRRGTALAAHWKKIPSHTDILLTHGPPYGILDVLYNDQHIGDKDLLKAVLDATPKVHVYGHIHESYGQQKKQGIRFINACVLNDSNELVNKPITFELTGK